MASAELNLGEIRRSSRQRRLPGHLEHYELPSYLKHSILQKYRETPSVSSKSTTSSRMDRLQMERDFIRDDVDRYCHQVEELKCKGSSWSDSAVQRIESRLEKSFSELKEVTCKIMDAGEEQSPQEVQEAAHVLSVTKRQIEKCQDQIADIREKTPLKSKSVSEVKVTKPQLPSRKKVSMERVMDESRRDETLKEPQTPKLEPTLPKANSKVTSFDTKGNKQEDIELRKFFQGMAKPQLPKFNGDRQKFQDWWGQFEVFVHKANVPTRYKMVLLKDTLTGKAADLVKGLGYTDIQYATAIRKLQSRFGGEVRVLQGHIDSILKVDPMEAHQLDKLDRFVNLLEDMIAKLYDSQQESELVGPSTLYTLVQQKIPEELLVLYQNSRKLGDQDGLEKFVEWLSQQITLRMSMAELRLGTKKNENAKGKTWKSNSKPSFKARLPDSGRTLVTESKSPKESKQSLSSSPNPTSFETDCPICQEKHKVVKCAKWWRASVQGRWDLAKEHRICYRCLQTGHQGKHCKSTQKCGIENCDKTHHRSLHPVSQRSDSKLDSKEETSEKRENRSSTSNFGIKDGKIVTSQVSLRLVPVLLRGSDGELRKVNALLDDGSDSTYVRTDVVRALGLTIQNKPLCISTLVDKSTEVDSGLVQITVESIDGETRRKLGARTLDHLCDNLNPPDWNKLKSKWKHLAGIDFPKLENRKIDLLVGSDHPELTLSLEEKIGRPGEPVARNTPLGWTCVGAFGSQKRDGVVNYAQCYMSGPAMDEELKKLWNQDIVKSSDTSIIYTAEEKLALQKAENSLEDVGGRYSIGIPWVKEKPNLIDNYSMAEKRLLNLEKTLKKRPEVAEQYRQVFKDNIEKGYIRELPETGVRTPGWYLPHFAVVKEDRETTKIRVVYDAAATYCGKCLNSEMLAGPKLQLDVIDILISFRSGSIGLMGDIKEMFCQIVMAEGDRKYHRILWRDLNPEAPIKIYEAQRLVFGDKASPFLAQFVIRQHANKLKEEYKLAAEVCNFFIYMDDAMRSRDEENVVIETRRQLSELLDSAGCKIRKWMSNNLAVLADVPEEDRAAGIIDLDDESDLPCIKALGVRWDAGKDVLGFSHAEVDQEVVTKRSLLSIIARLFDPLQLLSPFTVRAKFLLQQAWMMGLDWDEPFPPALQSQAQMWIAEITQVSNFEIPRCLHRGSPIETQLHTFTDASKLGYGTVLYARNRYADGSVSVRIIVAKARVTPLKAISIPRLELLAAVLGLRLAIKTSQLLNMNTVQYWSDSMDVIYWVHGQSRQYKPFVAHRVGEIHEESVPSQWRHVPGTQNPADLVTRGAKMADLTSQSIWTDGPDFLYKPEEDWPRMKKEEKIELSEDALKDSGKPLSFSATTAKSGSENIQPIDCTRFSSWLRLIRTTAWILRFVKMAKSRDKSKFRKFYLEADEVEEGRKYWIGHLQESRYSETKKRLIGGKPNPSCPLRDLTPYVDQDGLLRVGGRLQQSDLPYTAKHPWIVPARTHVTTLIVRHVHANVALHAKGVNATLAELRQEYWVINGREEVKKVDHDCVECRRRKGKTATQIMAPLPALRVTVPLRAFAKSGVDFAGPFLVKLTRRVHVKRWLCLFTCAASRAIHLEMAYSLDTPGFLNTFSRMTARRGKPEEVVSDNGTNFVGADGELGELVRALDQETIIDKAASKGIKWRFNPALGSHHGGLFEALIKSAKRALKAVLGNALLTDEELHTAIVEVEGLLNSRPLTYCSSDSKDQVLTPNHFLMGQAGGQLAPRVVDEIAFNPRHRWRYVQDLVCQAWRRWSMEFLSLLQTKGKWRILQQNLGVDDIVMMVDPTNPRGDWPLGRIAEVLPGRDGQVRTVRVQAKNKIYTRPITKLIPLVRGNSDTGDSDVVAEPFGHGGENVEARPVKTPAR